MERVGAWWNLNGVLPRHSSSLALPPKISTIHLNGVGPI